MEFASMELSKIYILRVDPGEDVLESIQEFIRAANIRQAVVLGGYGTFAAYHLHWVTHNRIPTDNLFQTGKGGIEVLSMNGLVVDGEPHVHITLSTRNGAFGGHLEPGCKAYVICEIFFAEVTGIKLTHEQVHVSVNGMGEGKVTRLLFNSKETSEDE